MANLILKKKSTRRIMSIIMVSVMLAVGGINAFADSAVTTNTRLPLNGRSGPGTSYRVTVSIPVKSTVELTGNVKNNFTEVVYKNKTVWVSSEYISKSNGGTAVREAYTTNTKLYLNMRKSASTSAGVIGKIPPLSKVTVKGSAVNNFYNVIYGNLNGYVSSDYICFENASSSTSYNTAESNITQRLDDMANGSYGNGVYKTGTRYTGAYYNEQCKGFAKKVHQIIFGYNIGSTCSKPNNYKININSSNTKLVGSLTNLSNKSNSTVSNLFASARPGDFIQVRRSHGGSHSMIYLSSNSNGVTVYECNVDGRNGIQKATYSWSKFRSSNTAVSVYTAKNYYLH